MNRIAMIAATLVLGLSTSAASASDAMPARAFSALGVAIAAQGDAALEQIRRELTESAREAMKPFLPDAPATPEPQPPAEMPVAQR